MRLYLFCTRSFREPLQEFAPATAKATLSLWNSIKLGKLSVVYKRYIQTG